MNIQDIDIVPNYQRMQGAKKIRILEGQKASSRDKKIHVFESHFENMMLIRDMTEIKMIPSRCYVSQYLTSIQSTSLYIKMYTCINGFDFKCVTCQTRTYYSPRHE